MSDEPLFKDADKEEAMYAPEGSETDRSERDVAGAGVILPAAGLANAGGTVGGTGGPTGTPAAGPGLAGAALAGELDDDPGNDRRTQTDVADGANDAAGQTPSG